MAKIIRLLAICLALAFALMLATPPTSVADGPRSYSINYGPTDGGDGHPWDDGTTEGTTPGDSTEPQQVQPDDPGTIPVFAYEKGFITWTQRILISFWTKVRETAYSQKTITTVAPEQKTRQTRRVQ